MKLYDMVDFTITELALPCNCMNSHKLWGPFQIHVMAEIWGEPSMYIITPFQQQLAADPVTA